MPSLLAPADLATLQTTHPNLQLIDVRLEDDFHACHLDGAHSNCVFEVAFAERATERIPAKDTPLVVYGHDSNSHESRVAALKLEALGYSRIHDLRDGLVGSENAGIATVRAEADTVRLPTAEGSLPVDLEASRLVWVGRNLLNKHWGTVSIHQGTLEFAHHQLVGGSFTLDLQRIECADLAGTDLHAVLIGHLQNDDFFDVANHPQAIVVIRRVLPIEGRREGSPDLRIEADLTLRGQTHAISFDAVTGWTDEGKPAAQATLTFDRTLWGSIYGSGKFFHRLAGHMVQDLIEIQVKIVGA